MENDKDIEFLKARKLLELKRRLADKNRKEKTAREVLVEWLVDRGIEVLEAAEASYPKQTELIIEKLVDLIKKGNLRGHISGGELLWLFRTLGMRIRVETTISIENHGKFISLADKLKTEEN